MISLDNDEYIIIYFNHIMQVLDLDSKVDHEFYPSP